MAQFCCSGLLMSFAFLFLLGGRQHVFGEERVARLPGYSGDLPFEMYTGYITVNETTSNNIFYYFIKSERNSTEDPLILWLTGGPGCSGFSGIVFEIGEQSLLQDVTVIHCILRMMAYRIVLIVIQFKHVSPQ
ncbi:unnamed protein product [Victoria cruziana]